MALNVDGKIDGAYQTSNWHVWRKVSDNFFLMAKQTNARVLCAPLYIASVQLTRQKRTAKSERYLTQNPDPTKITSVGARLRYYRYQIGMQQREIAEIVGLDRSTYINYENGQAYYPLDKLSAIADVLGIDIRLLLDEYHRFLYEGQGAHIRAMRERRGLSRDELARELEVHVGTVKRWELEVDRVKLETYRKMLVKQQAHDLAE